ncbi:MAG: hypothetical protein ACFB13_03330 [Kiloniellaceae bacterium]|mgnify:CR=1 FL=1
MTVLETEPPRILKVPVWQVTKAAYRDTFGNLGVFLIAAALPFGLTIGLDFAIHEETAGLGLGILHLVLSTVIGTFFEVAWYRHLLLDGATARPALVPHLDRRLMLFVGYNLLLTFLFVPGLFIEKLLPQAAASAPLAFGSLAFVLHAVAAYISVRFAFVFPWIALDAPERLGESWHRTTGNGLRILIAQVVVAAPFVLLVFAFGAVIAIIAPDLGALFENGRLEGGMRWFALIAGNILLFLYYALSCAVLARAFCALTGWQPDRRELLERFE